MTKTSNGRVVGGREGSPRDRCDSAVIGDGYQSARSILDCREDHSCRIEGAVAPYVVDVASLPQERSLERRGSVRSRVEIGARACFRRRVERGESRLPFVTAWHAVSRVGPATPATATVSSSSKAGIRG